MLRVVASVLFSAALAPAQESSIIRTTTRAVVVDVSVVDKRGQPVNDLTKADFSILENGKPQKISTFEAIRPARNLPPLSQTIILIDEMNTAFPDSAFVCYSIDKLIGLTVGHLDQRTQILTLTDAGLKVL